MLGRLLVKEPGNSGDYPQSPSVATRKALMMTGKGGSREEGDAFSDQPIFATSNTGLQGKDPRHTLKR